MDTPEPSEKLEFEKEIVLLYDRARSAHRGVDLDLEIFSARIQSVLFKKLSKGSPWPAASRLVSELHAVDLYLSTACARKNDAAWRRFHALYFRFLADVFCYAHVSRSSAGDLANGILDDMFLPDRSGESRIASYDARSSLATWLRVIAIHRQINEKQKKRYEYCVLNSVPEPSDLMALIRMESILRDGSREAAAINAFVRACASLSSKERQLLVWRYGHDFPLGRIAEVAGVHQSTVTRQIERICTKLRAKATSILATEHRLSGPAIEECMAILADGLDDAGFVWDALNKSDHKDSERARTHENGSLNLRKST